MYFRILFILFTLYILYRFVFDFFLPVYRQSRKIHRQFQHMQDQMNSQGDPTPPPYGPEPPRKDTYSPAKSDKDYIDFEEIKD